MVLVGIGLFASGILQIGRPKIERIAPSVESEKDAVSKGIRGASPVPVAGQQQPPAPAAGPMQPASPPVEQTPSPPPVAQQTQPAAPPTVPVSCELFITMKSGDVKKELVLSFTSPR